MTTIVVTRRIESDGKVIETRVEIDRQNDSDSVLNASDIRAILYAITEEAP